MICRSPQTGRRLWLLAAVAVTTTILFSGCLSLLGQPCGVGAARISANVHDEIWDHDPERVYDVNRYVATGKNVTFTASPHSLCAPHVAQYQWTIRPWTQTGGISIEPEAHMTEGPTLTWSPSHVMWALVEVRVLDDRGRLSPEPDLFSMYTYFVRENVSLPSNGTSLALEFEAYCCILAMGIDLSHDGGGAPLVDWIKSVKVAPDGPLIWEGRSSGRDAAHNFQTVLGDDWDERIRLEIRPNGGLHPPPAVGGSYAASVYVGPQGGALPPR